MKKLDNTRVISIVTSELEQSLSYSDQSVGNAVIDVRTPLDYYLGNANGKEVEGRSTVTSTDVADAIEWIMPSIMEAFTSTSDVISFDPLNPGDEDQAALETAWVHDVIMKRNNGFVAIHTAVKDALLHGNGILKTYYTRDESSRLQRYTALTEEQLQLVVASSELEILHVTPNGDNTYDLTLRQTTVHHRINVECVPLENFRVNADHNSVDLSGARFASHEMLKTVSELRKMGVSDDTIKQLPRTNVNKNSFRYTAQGESVIGNVISADPSMEFITLNESYLWMDYNLDGVSEYVKVTTVGEDSPTYVISVEELPDGSPWVACTAILMSHKFRGLSIYDRIKEIQDQSTAILRSTLDNFYLQNNQEKEVVENLVVDMDEILTSIPGGIKRVKKAGAINPIPVQAFTDAPIQLMRYLAELKAGRTGVSAEGPSAPQNIGDRVGSEGVSQLMTAKEALAGLIIRVLAETGLKELYTRVRDLAHMHVDSIEDYKFRDRWIKVNPQEWVARSSTSVCLSTGSGNRQSKIAAISQIKEIQAQIASSPFTYLLSDKKIYNTVDDYCKYSGLNSAYRYLLDPDSDEAQAAKQAQQQQQAQQAQQQQEAMVAQMKLEASLAEAEMLKAQAQRDNVTLKAQIETMKQQRELEESRFNTRITAMQSQLDQLKVVAEGEYKDRELDFKEKALDQQTFLKLVEINANTKKEESNGLQQSGTD